MSVIYKKIRAALERHLEQSDQGAGAFSIPDIAWENVDYSPTTGTEFLKVQIQPTSRRPSVLGTNPEHRYQGIMTILCHFPENVGPGVTHDLADQLLERFNSTTDITWDGVTVSIEYAQQESSYTNSPWYITPITVAWYIYD